MARTVLEEVRKKNWRLEQVDTVILLEKPKLGPHKQNIRKSLSKILDLDAPSISIKAKTMEGLGPEGQGLAVTCEAIVVMRKKS